MKKILWKTALISLMIIFCSGPLLFAQQSNPPNHMITMTTYYPAPFGAYKKMTISDSVGIGTTNPGMVLEIKGKNIDGLDRTVGLYPDGPGSSAGIIFAQSKADLDNYPTTGDIASLGLGTVATQFGNDVQPGDIALTSRMGKDIHLATRVGISNEPTRLIVKNNGNVGIGTATPFQELPPPASSLEVTGRIKAGDYLVVGGRGFWAMGWGA